MSEYRRGQVEWALWRLKAGEETRQSAPSPFLSRIKRLLDVDRTLIEAPRPRGSSAFAFSSAPPGGRGENAAFSKSDALILWLALELLELGFKQQEVVQQLRRARPLLIRDLGSVLDAPPARIKHEKGRFVYEGLKDEALQLFLALPRVEGARDPWGVRGKDGAPVQGPALLSPRDLGALLEAAPQAKLALVPAALAAYRLNALLAHAPEIKDGRQAKPPD
jgi:hypothetical protein